MKFVHLQTILSQRHSGKRKFSQNKGFPTVKGFTNLLITLCRRLCLGSLDRDPPGQRPPDRDPLDKDPPNRDPLDRDPLDRDPLDRDLRTETPLTKTLLTETPWTETPWIETPYEQNHRQVKKDYLPATSFAGGKNGCTLWNSTRLNGPNQVTNICTKLERLLLYEIFYLCCNDSNSPVGTDRQTLSSIVWTDVEIIPGEVCVHGFSPRDGQWRIRSGFQLYGGDTCWYWNTQEHIHVHRNISQNILK